MDWKKKIAKHIKAGIKSSILSQLTVNNTTIQAVSDTTKLTVSDTTILINTVSPEESKTFRSFIQSFDFILIDDLKINFFVLGCLLGLFYSMVILVFTDLLEVFILTNSFCFQRLTTYFLLMLFKLKKRIRKKSFYVFSIFVNTLIENIRRYEEFDSYV